MNDEKLKNYFASILQEVRTGRNIDSTTALQFGFFLNRGFPFGDSMDLLISIRCNKKIQAFAHSFEKSEFSVGKPIYTEIVSIVHKTIESISINNKIINVAEAIKSDGRTLFELRRDQDFQTFASSCFQSLIDETKKHNCNRIILVPAVRIIANNQSIHELGLYCVSRKDTNLWNSILYNSRIFEPSWDIDLGKFRSDKSSYFVDQEFDSWLAYFETGHMETVVQNFQYNISMLISLLVVFDEAVASHPISASTVRNDDYGMSFSEHGNSTHRSVRVAVPNFTRKLDLTSLYPQIKQWLAVWISKDLPKRNRMQNACYYFCKGLSANSVDAFVWNFIALDSLFGEQFNVEQSIIFGVTNTIAKNPIANRIKSLYSLRCELVHGGIRSLNEWDSLSKYYKENNSSPQRDLRIIVSDSIRSCINNDLIPANQYE